MTATATPKVPTDIAIAQAAKLRPIADVAAEVGLTPDDILPYGRYKAKVSLDLLERHIRYKGESFWNVPETQPQSRWERILALSE